VSAIPVITLGAVILNIYSLVRIRIIVKMPPEREGYLMERITSGVN
jgi:hypothetical protein